MPNREATEMQLKTARDSLAEKSGKQGLNYRNVKDSFDIYIKVYQSGTKKMIYLSKVYQSGTKKMVYISKLSAEVLRERRARQKVDVL